MIRGAPHISEVNLFLNWPFSHCFLMNLSAMCLLVHCRSLLPQVVCKCTPSLMRSYCSEVEGEKGLIIRAYTSSSLQEVDQCLSLSCEAVDNVFWVVGDGCLEEERKVGKNGAEALAINLHS